MQRFREAFLSVILAVFHSICFPLNIIFFWLLEIFENLIRESFQQYTCTVYHSLSTEYKHLYDSWKIFEIRISKIECENDFSSLSLNNYQLNTFIVLLELLLY